MASRADVTAALVACAERLHAERGALSPLLHGSYGFVILDVSGGWTLVVGAEEVAATSALQDTDVRLVAASAQVLHAVISDPSQLIGAHQEGMVDLSDDTYGPVFHRLLEAQWQSDARQIRVLSRVGSWGRTR